jgi:hypothetical protein
MVLLYTDESNIDPASAEFFVYAGVSIPGDQAAELSSEIDSLRRKHGYKPEDLLKFNTVERPVQISPDSHKELKREVIEAAVRHDVKLFATFTLHALATSAEVARRHAINTVCFHFDCYLHRLNDAGIVLIDSFQDKSIIAILREKFSIGVKGLPYTPQHRLQRVLGVHLASVGSSNFCSVIDIVLGSLRHAVNIRSDRGKLGLANTLLGQLSPLCIRTNLPRVDELSIFFSPKVVKSHAFLQKYLELRDFLAAGGIEASQVPTGERNY